MNSADVEVLLGGEEYLRMEKKSKALRTTMEQSGDITPTCKKCTCGYPFSDAVELAYLHNDGIECPNCYNIWGFVFNIKTWICALVEGTFLHKHYGQVPSTRAQICVFIKKNPPYCASFVGWTQRSTKSSEAAVIFWYPTSLIVIWDALCFLVLWTLAGNSSRTRRLNSLVPFFFLF